MESEKDNPYDAAFGLEQKSFQSGDGEFLYQFIRHYMPRKVVEIGAGSSTKIASTTVLENRVLWWPLQVFCEVCHGSDSGGTV